MAASASYSQAIALALEDLDARSCLLKRHCETLLSSLILLPAILFRLTSTCASPLLLPCWLDQSQHPHYVSATRQAKRAGQGLQKQQALGSHSSSKNTMGIHMPCTSCIMPNIKAGAFSRTSQRVSRRSYARRHKTERYMTDGISSEFLQFSNTNTTH